MAYTINLGTSTESGTLLRLVLLRNAPQSVDKIIKLRESLMMNGWVGRPVILLDNGDFHIAFTGSHRLAAAHGLDDLIETVELSADLTEEEYAIIDAAHDDDALLAAFITLSEIRGGMDKVVKVMRAEVEANNAEWGVSGPA